MSINDNVVSIVVSEEIIPYSCIWDEGIVEDKFNLWIEFTDHRSNASVEIFKRWDVSVPPGFIDGFQSIDSWMVTPSGHETANVLDCPVDVVLVDPVILGSVPVAHPGSVLNAPVLEVILISPDKIGGFTRVVKAVLRVL
jgi:adenine deaminase